MLEGFDKLAGAIGDTLKTAPTFYEDALQPSVQEIGKFAARIPRAINAAFSGLDKWILNKEYNVDETKKLIAQKLENVDPEKIVTPDAYVAVPTIQAISYSMDSEELRNLYANLLAKAMNSDTKEQVHPSFVEIIKQLSPIDSLVFKTIMQRDTNAIINLIYENDDGDFRYITSNVTDITISSTEIVSVSIDNLVKQGIISIATDTYIDDHAYDKIISSNFYKLKQMSCPITPDGFKFSYQKRIINKTNIGILFYKVCVAEL